MTHQPVTRLRRRLPWMWECRDYDYAWHRAVDDRGFGNTHAEAHAAAVAHARRWHDPKNPIKICAAEIPPPDWDLKTEPWNCVAPQGHDGPHLYLHGYDHQVYNDSDWPPHDDRGILGLTFDEYGREIQTP